MKHTGIDEPNMVSVLSIDGRKQFIIRFEIDNDGEIYHWNEVALPVGVWGRSKIISAIIRMRYSADSVEAIVNNVLADPFNDDRMSAYKSLQEWRKKAKDYAAELIDWAEKHCIDDLILQEDEEIYEATDIENKPDGILQLAQALSLVKLQAQDLSDEQAAEVPALFPTWESLIGESVEVGKRLFYAGRLWKVLQAHTIQENWSPDVASSLFTEVVAQQEGEPEIGTLENPIPYNGNMELEEGKYYSQDGVVYRCFRSSGAPVYHPLSQLVGLYVEVV